MDNRGIPRRARSFNNPWRPTNGYYNGNDLPELWERNPNDFYQDRIGNVTGESRSQRRLRHTGVRVSGREAQIFFTERGDQQEHIRVSRINLNVRSEAGAAPENVSQLRDPDVFQDDDGSLYLLYSGRGEDGIGIAALQSSRQRIRVAGARHDAVVRGGSQSGSNFRNNDLAIQNSSGTGDRRSFLRFDEPNAPRTIRAAVLRLWAENSGNGGRLEIFGINSGLNFNEASITRNNAPGQGSRLARVDMGPRNQWYEFDVTQHVENARRNGTDIGFVLRGSSSSQILMTLPKNTILIAISCTAVALIGFKISGSRSQNNDVSESSSTEENLNEKSQARRTHQSSVNLTSGTNVNWVDLTLKSLNQGTGRDFAQQIQQINSESLSDISSAILSAHKENPAEVIAWLEELSLELAALKAHDRAALLLELVSPFEETSIITSKVFSNWIQTDSAETLNFFKELSEEDKISTWQLSLVAELFQGEHVDLYSTYQTWIDESEPNLKGSLVGALVPHLLPENIDPVSEIIIENLANDRQFEFALSQLVEVRSPEDPVQNLEWLSQLDLPRSQIGVQVAAFGSAIGHIARTDIDIATELLNQDDFLTNYFPASQEELVDENGNWSGDARWFFDAVLTNFIEEIRDTDVELAQNSVESIFDPIQREEFRRSFVIEDEDVSE